MNRYRRNTLMPSCYFRSIQDVCDLTLAVAKPDCRPELRAFKYTNTAYRIEASNLRLCNLPLFYSSFSGLILSVAIEKNCTLERLVFTFVYIGAQNRRASKHRHPRHVMLGSEMLQEAPRCGGRSLGEAGRSVPRRRGVRLATPGFCWPVCPKKVPVAVVASEVIVVVGNVIVEATLAVVATMAVVASLAAVLVVGVMAIVAVVAVVAVMTVQI